MVSGHTRMASSPGNRTRSLPLTGAGCIRKVLTDLAYLEIEDGAFILRERAPGVSIEEIANLDDWL